MAIIKPAASGNWSNPATWVGGVVPGVADDVDLDGKFSMVFDAGVPGLHIQVNSITSPGTTGQLDISMATIGTCAITCPGGIASGLTVPILNITGAAIGETITITANITKGNNGVVVDNGSSADIVIVGDATGIVNDGGGDLTITGNAVSNTSVGVNMGGTGVFTMNGSITADGTGHGCNLAGSGDANFNGDIIGNAGIGLFMASGSSDVFVIGDVIASSVTFKDGISMAGGWSGNLDITGDSIAHDGHGISRNGVGTTIVRGNIFGSDTAINKFGIDASSNFIGAVEVTGNSTGGTFSNACGIKNGDNPLIIGGDAIGGSGLLAHSVWNVGTEICTISGSIVHGQAGSKPAALSGGNFIFSPEDGKVVTDSAGTDAFAAAGGGGGGGFIQASSGRVGIQES